MVLRNLRIAAACGLACTPVPAGARSLPASVRTPGTIEGRVVLLREPAPVEPRPDPAALGAGGPRDQVDRRRSVVFLETAPQGAFEAASPPRAVLDQRRETFVPYVLAVRVGTTVDFPNRDRTYHNVFSLSKTKRFDLGRYPRGESRSVRFDQPGVVRVFCEIHSHMSAFILVFAHRFFAITDADARYRIEGIPPGSYSLAVWHQGEVRQRRTVDVPETGGTVQLDIEL